MARMLAEPPESALRIAELEGANQRLEQAREALRFISDLTAEELPYASVGTGAEVALRHAHSRADVALAALSAEPEAPHG